MFDMNMLASILRARGGGAPAQAPVQGQPAEMPMAMEQPPAAAPAQPPAFGLGQAFGMNPQKQKLMAALAMHAGGQMGQPRAMIPPMGGGSPGVY